MLIAKLKKDKDLHRWQAFDINACVRFSVSEFPNLCKVFPEQTKKKTIKICLVLMQCLNLLAIKIEKSAEFMIFIGLIIIHVSCEST